MPAIEHHPAVFERQRGLPRPAVVASDTIRNCA